MKLSRRARYALRMMLEIAIHSNGTNGNGKKISLSQVAKKTSISRRYLEQLAIGLKNAQLIIGMTGKGGGYLLTKPASEIKVGEIVEASIGPINIVECLLQPELCVQVDFCECRHIYERINKRISEVLYDFSLADLANSRNHKELELEDDEQGSEKQMGCTTCNN
jgi:Rrf2 family protein